MRYADGWRPILEALEATLEREYKDNKPEYSYKEKFGTLRIEWRGGVDDRMSILEDFIDELTERICSECGQEGKSRDGSWVKVLCDTCHTSDTNNRL
jgi:hypothetical protein